MKIKLRLIDSVRALMGWQAVPAAIIAIYLFAGLFGPSIALYHSTDSSTVRNVPPLQTRWEPGQTTRIESGKEALRNRFGIHNLHLLGTDSWGRDIFSVVLYGARTSFSVVAAGTLIGTPIGIVLGMLTNGLKPNRRIFGYVLIGCTIIPYAIFSFNHPHGLYRITDMGLPNPENTAYQLSSLGALIAIAMTVSFGCVAFAYRFDQKCVKSWLTQVGTHYRRSEFIRLFHQQLLALGPWIPIAAIASATAIYLGTTTDYIFNNDPWIATWWVYEPLPLAHIGILSPLVPLVAVPIAFVALGVWWWFRRLTQTFDRTSHEAKKSDSRLHLADRETTQKPTATPIDVECRSTQSQVVLPIADQRNMPIEAKILSVLATIVILVIFAKFVFVDIVSLSEKFQFDLGLISDFNQPQSVQERWEFQDCIDAASATSSMRNSIPIFDVRCLELYKGIRNAPSHQETLRNFWSNVPRTITAAMFASVAAVALVAVAVNAGGYSAKTIHGVVAIISFVGLTMTFGLIWWVLISIWSAQEIAETGLLVLNPAGILETFSLVRDASIGLGVSYLIAVNLILKLDQPFRLVVRNRSPVLVPLIIVCTAVGSASILLLHHPFPSGLFFADYSYAVIADESISTELIPWDALFRHWLWTYWIALLVYGALVLLAIAIAKWGVDRISAVRSQGHVCMGSKAASTPVSHRSL